MSVTPPPAPGPRATDPTTDRPTDPTTDAATDAPAPAPPSSRQANPGLTRASALWWGLQFSLLNPALALLLVEVYGASPSQVGTVLVIYNSAAFVAALVVPAWADRRGRYLQPLLGCALLTVVLAVVLAATSTLAVAVVALVVLGGPASVGVSLLFAHLRHAGASRERVVTTRAWSSVAWVAGPPLATLAVSQVGQRSVAWLLLGVAFVNAATTVALLRRTRDANLATTSPPLTADTSPRATSSSAPMSPSVSPSVSPSSAGPAGAPADGASGPRRAGRSRMVAVGAVVVAFVLLQATNNAAVAVMSLLVSRDLGLDLLWAGVALGLAAGLEVPALFAMARLSRRLPDLVLLASGALVGVAYYVGMALVTGPVMLLSLQVLNAWFFAAVAGVGLTFFQDVLPRPGLAAGIFANTRRVGAVVSGPIIAWGAASAWGYSGVFAVSAAMTAIALILVVVSARALRQQLA